MATNIDNIRPAVLDAETEQELDEYLRFRHLFRNIYGFDLEWERCRELLIDVPPVFARLESDIQRFDEFLRALEEMI
jgi:hypothetical protein